MNELEKPDTKNQTDLSLRAKSGPRVFASICEKVFGGFRIGNEVFIRVLLLFLVLCAIKIVTLVGFRKYLFELHWRVSNEADNWVNAVAFYGFAVLVGLALWRLNTFCVAAGTRTIRLANCCVLVIGAAFIFFTFHEGEKNYLDPVMNGILKWPDLLSYLSLNLFFRPPFLAAWIFVYAAVYYGLVRSGREHLILNVTAVTAAVYIMLYLGDLMIFRSALIVADCIGVVCLLASLKAQRSLGLFWLGMPLVWLGFWFAVFGRLESRLGLASLYPEFAILFWGALVFFAGVTALAWRRGFFTGWSWVVPFVFAAFLLLANINYSWAPSYDNVLCMGFTLPCYFLGEFALAMLMMALAMVYLRFRPRGSLWWLDILNLILIALALVDLRLSQIMGTRLDWQLLSLAFGETPRMMWRMARPFLPAVAMALLVVAGLYAGFLRLARWCLGNRNFSGSSQLTDGGRFFVLWFVILGFAGYRLIGYDKASGQAAWILAGTSPLWQRAASPVMDAQTFTNTARQLGMSGMLGLQRSAPSGNPRDLNVVLVFQESTYNKHLSLFSGKQETQPLLSRYKDRMEVFPNFFSNFAGSINARFATFTGLYPVADYKAFTTDRVPVASIFEVLRERGYSSSLFYSSSFDYTGFRDFLRDRGIDEMYDADTMPGERKTQRVSWGLREEETLTAMQDRIKKYATEKKKFFLTYIPAAPHYPFDGTPARFSQFKRETVTDFTPLYLNELLYMDWIISSLVDQLRDSGLLENTLIVITDDHGEMLGTEEGLLGHGWAVTPELANVPLIIMDPAEHGYRINYRLGSQVDLLPTVLDLLGIPVPANQLYQGGSLYASGTAHDGAIYLDSFRQYGIIDNQRIICGDRESDGKKPLRVFSITNDVARTGFKEAIDTNSPVSPISSFDEFQASFLRNYSHYCDLLQRQKVAR